VLVEADPADRSWVPAAPSTVTLTFNEPVTLAPDGLRVFDADAGRVDLGSRQDASTPDRIETDLPDDLPDGGYVVTYRVTSADSHPIAGALTFTVGEGTEVDDAFVAELFGGAGSDWTGVVGPTLRGLGYLGVLVAGGAVLFGAVVASSPRDRRSARWLGSRAIVLGGVVSLLAVPVQAVAVTGRGFLEVFRPGGGLGETLLATSFGHSTLVRIAGLSALWLAWSYLVVDRRGGARQHLGPGLAAVVAVGSYVLDGHQRTVEPIWLLATADLVHLLGAAAWIGCLVLLAVAVRRRRLDDDPVGAARLVVRTSSVALWSVLALSLPGWPCRGCWSVPPVPSPRRGTGGRCSRRSRWCSSCWGRALQPAAARPGRRRPARPRRRRRRRDVGRRDDPAPSDGGDSSGDDPAAHAPGDRVAARSGQPGSSCAPPRSSR
jgi:copper transport protein